nr:PREDICTED: histidine-containing phosphotransfer protein 1-like isoform X2 [Musa acuminata subsp. malaccensis]
MELHKLRRVYIEFASFVFHDGILDNQYTQLQQLQDESEPKFVLQQDVDFEKLDAFVRKLTGSSASIGAKRVKDACMAFHDCCKKGSKEGCLKCLQQLTAEYRLVKRKLETLFKMETQILAAGGSVPLLSQ